MKPANSKIKKQNIKQYWNWCKQGNPLNSKTFREKSFQGIDNLIPVTVSSLSKLGHDLGKPTHYHITNKRHLKSTQFVITQKMR